jgi:UDP-sulfoquinovose synthase
MKVLILGGDGYLGWPTAIHLSALNYEVYVVDNYMRRKLMEEHNVKPLYPVLHLPERIKAWKNQSSQEIKYFIGDLNRWEFVSEVFKKTLPDVIIHYAEQPSAPYSMMSRESASLTLHNNLGVTKNIIYAIKEFVPNSHLIKLGTMGEYGTPNIDIEEGWINIEHKGRKDKFLYPRQSGSLYHTTKIMDTDLLWYYVRVWGLKVTDLMQGPVYGIYTDETRSNEDLLTFFSYDEIFGTVLNRFIVQAVAGYPLTVYGQGGQTRGYLNIKDTLQCIRIAIESKPKKAELRILNQYTETFTVQDLANLVKETASKYNLNVKIKNIKNPRIELEEHYYNPSNKGFIDLGLKPNYLTKNEIGKIIEKVLKHKDKINIDKIFQGINWKK